METLKNVGRQEDLHSFVLIGFEKFVPAPDPLPLGRPLLRAVAEREHRQRSGMSRKGYQKSNPLPSRPDIPSREKSKDREELKCRWPFSQRATLSPSHQRRRQST